MEDIILKGIKLLGNEGIIEKHDADHSIKNRTAMHSKDEHKHI